MVFLVFEIVFVLPIWLLIGVQNHEENEKRHNFPGLGKEPDDTRHSLFDAAGRRCYVQYTTTTYMISY